MLGACLGRECLTPSLLSHTAPVHKSPFFQMLLEKAIGSAEFRHALYWQLNVEKGSPGFELMYSRLQAILLATIAAKPGEYHISPRLSGVAHRKIRNRPSGMPAHY